MGCGDVQVGVGKCGEVWEGVGKCGEVQGGVGRCGKVWGGVGRCGEVQEVAHCLGKEARCNAEARTGLRCESM